MNIFRRHARAMNMIQRILDVLILLVITRLTEKWLGQPELMRMLAIYGSVLLFVIFSLFSMYKSCRSIPLLSQVESLFILWILILLVFNILILFLSNKAQFSILWPFCLFQCKEFLLWGLFVFMGLAAVRLITRSFLYVARKNGYNQRSTVIAGAGEAGRKLAQYLYENRWMGININGFFDDSLAEGDLIRSSPRIPGSVLGPIEKCPDFALNHHIDMVFIALPMRAEDKISKLVWDLGTKGVDVFMVPDLFTIGIQKSKIHQMGELHLMDLNLYPGWKRVFDILFSLVAILIFSPLLLLIMVLIKLEDRGPVLYKHSMVMESGKKFYCYKFRTMHVDADKRLKDILEKDPAIREEWEQTYKIKNDPRVTYVGKLLRKTSLDELPQFLNVLLGEMSVVGARPIVPEELQKYYKDTALTYCATKSGLTGPWQCGKRSDTEDYSERVALDKWYVLNCSFWVDIKIIFRTVWSMLSRKGRIDWRLTIDDWRLKIEGLGD